MFLLFHELEMAGVCWQKKIFGILKSDLKGQENRRYKYAQQSQKSWNMIFIRTKWKEMRKISRHNMKLRKSFLGFGKYLLQPNSFILKRIDFVKVILSSGSTVTFTNILE